MDIFAWVWPTLSLAFVWSFTLGMIVGGGWMLSRSWIGWLMLVIGALVLPITVAVTLPLLRSSAKRVVVETTTKTVWFHNVWVHRGFFPPKSSASWGCPFSELHFVQLMPGRRGGPDWLLIETERGRVYLSSFNSDLHDLENALLPHAQLIKPPLSQSGYLPGILAGVIVGVALILALVMGWAP